MNILIIIPQLTTGGSERVASELSLALNKKHSVFILLYENRVTYPYSGKIIFLKQKKTPFVNIICQIIHLRNIIKIYDIKCSISFSPNSNILNILSFTCTKTIVTIHTHLSEYYKKKPYINKLINKLIIKYIYSKADKIITVSKEAREDLVDRFDIRENKLKTIYNFYNYGNIKKMANEDLEESRKILFKNKQVILNIGRLTYSKGQWNLIRSFSILIKKNKNAILIILGAGDLYYHLSSLINHMNLNDSVFLLGFHNNPYKYIKIADLFVLSSKYEGLSNVILESIGLGTPVVSTHCKSGPQQILGCNRKKIKNLKNTYVKCKYGILTPVTHPENILYAEPLTKNELLLSDAMDYLLKNENIRHDYSIKGIERSLKFSVSQQIENWEAVINL